LTNVTAVSFSFTSGVQTVNNTNALQFFGFGTNSSGMINAWNIGTGTFAGCGSPAFDCIVVETTDAGFFVGDRTENHGTTPVSSAFNNYAPGTWTSSVSTTGVPEPSVLMMLGTGLCALITGLRKRLS
jgi:PEP-CTERM motif